ncbi:hypothetical protein [Rathayibacter tanaceti]|uniref:Uncharacterized protein n=2 Tax=Rathayibacter tanaceti TaxID=1671680 RepID=A0ACD2XKD2_9MICO|nr:hypothetical protein [Rathayibacter tanaceti]KZX22340.1 hypothetical protein ACH61_00493 [Rathayibacter tanaceti]TCO37581.1 hypothetical protein EV639_104250 [Rathayibacter tanaceti]
MILSRTHANRWVARARRNGAVLGVITLVPDLPRPTYRTVRLDAATGERVLLRDTEALEDAFAVLLAGLERARFATADGPEDRAERGETDERECADPAEHAA